MVDGCLIVFLLHFTCIILSELHTYMYSSEWLNIIRVTKVLHNGHDTQVYHDKKRRDKLKKVLYDSAFSAQVDDHQVRGPSCFSTTKIPLHGQNKHNGLMQHKTGEEMR